jgi:oligopeptidase B
MAFQTTFSMTRILLFLFFLCPSLMLFAQPTIGLPKDPQTPMSSQPPVAQIKPYPITTHGDTRVDNYYWLKEREDETVIKYLTAENDYLEQTLNARTGGLQKELYEEMIARLKQDDNSVPQLNNGYWYYSRYEKGKEYPFYCRKKGTLDAAEEIILDMPALSVGASYLALGDYAVSPDNNKIAYTLDTLSRRTHQIYIKDLKSGKVTPVGFDLGGGDVVWANDSRHIFFTAIEPNSLRYDKIYRFDTQKAKKPVVVYEEKDETFYYIGVGKEKDNSYITILCNSTLQNEVLIIDADKPTDKFVPLYPRSADHLYNPSHHGESWYIVSNYKAKNFRVMIVPEKATKIDDWKSYISQRRDVLIEGIDVFKDFMVVQERSKANVALRIIQLKDKKEHYIEFGEDAYDAGMGYNPEFNATKLRYSYTSLTTPNSVYDYDMISRAKTLKKEEPVLGGFDRKNYMTSRIWVNVTDGTEVPVTLVHRVDSKPDPNTPILVYSYGSYGSSTDPVFSSARLSLLDRGFAYAIVHIRGGQEMGRQWYEDGKLLKKKNTFTDFNDCVRFLQASGYASPKHTYAMGGSAGGLLMGAIINMEPGLYKGVIAAVPFVDVVTTMQDATIPLTTAEWDEWGNPVNKEYYDYMKSYSPYDNIRKMTYPALLVTTGLHDSQVQYWEPAKWVAKLRAESGSANPIYLKTDMEAGHGGASGRYARYKQTALMYAFLIDLEGIKPRQ